jgi:hypothetical protein
MPRSANIQISYSSSVSGAIFQDTSRPWEKKGRVFEIRLHIQSSKRVAFIFPLALRREYVDIEVGLIGIWDMDMEGVE